MIYINIVFRNASNDTVHLLDQTYIIWTSSGRIHTNYVKKQKSQNGPAISIHDRNTTFHLYSVMQQL